MLLSRVNVVVDVAGFESPVRVIPPSYVHFELLQDDVFRLSRVLGVQTVPIAPTGRKVVC